MESMTDSVSGFGSLQQSVSNVANRTDRSASIRASKWKKTIMKFSYVSNPGWKTLKIFQIFRQKVYNVTVLESVLIATRQVSTWKY